MAGGTSAQWLQLFGRPLTLGVLRALAVRVAGMASAMLLYLVLARSLVVAEFGTYALVLGWLNLLAMFATVGTANATLRFLPQYSVRGEFGLASGYLRYVMRLSLAVALPLTAVAIGFVYLRFDARTASIAAVLLLAIPLVALIAQRQATLRVSGSIVFALLPEQVIRPLATVALVCVFGLLWAPLDALHAGASFATLCADLAAQYPQADIVVEAGSLLRRWVEEELLSASTEPLTAVGK